MTPQEIQNFYNELGNRLNDLAQRLQAGGIWKRRPWTREVKRVLVELGVARHYQTCAAGVPQGIGNTWGEWLYDVVWLKTNPDAKFFTLAEVGLVAEIEWGSRWEAWEDYQKLHMASEEVDVRLLICNGDRELLNRCEQQLTDQNKGWLLYLRALSPGHVSPGYRSECVNSRCVCLNKGQNGLIPSSLRLPKVDTLSVIGRSEASP